MRICVTLEHRFCRTPDGSVWTQTMFAYPFWSRYLDVFDDVHVIARVCDVVDVPAGWLRANGVDVSFIAVPYYLGPWQYLLRAGPIKRVIRGAVGPNDAVIMRVGSQLASCLQPVLYRAGHPYGVEVVGDPYDVFSPGAMTHPLRPLFRWWFPRRLRNQVAGACAAAYVTEAALQRRYPTVSGMSMGCSDVELPDEAFVSGPRSYSGRRNRFKLVTVGTLNQLYKAPDVLIRAVALCVRNGLDLSLTVVGDGKHRQELKGLAETLHVGDRVQFAGQVSAGAAVRTWLDTSDLFVLPSRQEGLPRALLEAMARGLPCIGSTVGGIPELLEADDLVPAGDIGALAAKIRAVLTQPKRMAAMSARNLRKAEQYHDRILKGKRIQFYRYVRATTEDWIKARE